MNRRRLIAQVILALSCVVSGSAVSSQVQDFRLVASIGHFDITCAPEFDERADDIGRRAERAYQRVASSLQHELSLRPLLVLFATRDELQRAVQTRTVPGNREHLIVTLDVPDAQLDGHLVHELSHVFLFDIVPASFHHDIPSWILEGLAEHQRGEFHETELILLKEMVRTDALPTLGILGLTAPPDDGRRDAIVGHAAFDFLVSRAGANSPRRFLASFRENATDDPMRAYLALVRLTPSDFNRAFGAYLKARFAK